MNKLSPLDVLNIWAGIQDHGRHLCILPDRFWLTQHTASLGTSASQFVGGQFLLPIQRDMWFRHDGFSSHFSSNPALTGISWLSQMMDRMAFLPAH
ncbi:hypothetical protein AVEN_232115-1 [Araneus ventricosus]|uniref:Uncharacterized protein n=1 Tax=Araneus ventricosus TaxID=182803 RepID=A0A4Y2FSU9_ARAVE|nr:hypothetical protein AVEN_232115-1 [Araneus ventricosus]